jgi:hypothetical protein
MIKMMDATAMVAGVRTSPTDAGARRAYAGARRAYAGARRA